MPAANKFKVTSTSLNIRTRTVVAPSTLIATLPNGHIVTKLSDTNDINWWKVSTDFQGTALEGVVNKNYLSPVSEFVQPPLHRSIRAVHLSTNQSIRRNDDGGRAFPLNETGQPQRTATNVQQKVSQLKDIIKWLKVDRSQRYLPTGGTTFCNIYSYDYCFLSGAFIPRVWWNRRAIATLASGGQVRPLYDETVTELNANSLYNWFEEFGGDFGWSRIFDLTELQNAANEGKACIIVAQRKDLNRSGHICAVVPEVEDHSAVRSASNVTVPLQSQAGVNNFQYGGRVWWTGSQFRKFAFWIHD